MLGYQTVYDKSMNGIKTLSDGKSLISDGNATHDNITYTTTLKSSDGKIQMTNNTLTSEIINATTINSTNEVVGTLTTTNLNVDNYGFYVDGINNTITSSLPISVNNSLKVVSNVLTLENSNINQTGTTTTNNLKTSSINGTLTCQSDIIQSGGNTQLKNITCDNITMNNNKSINQNGGGITNSLGTTSISNLTVTTSMVFPSSVTIPDATQTGDLSFTEGSRITQDLTEAGTNYNTLMYSKISKIEVNGNITQSSGTTQLLDTVIQGTSEIQGNITQTAGQTIIKSLGCDQITLNANKDIFFNNGTGKIDQSVSSGTNLLNSITMNSNTNLSQSGTGIINQSGIGTNILKNTNIDGTLTLLSGKSISQSGITNNQLQNTTISNLTCPTATITDLSLSNIGNVSNQEIQYLDGVTSPIQTQIDNISSTTTNNNTSLTGISYTLETDTTLIDNNVTISSGKNLLLGSTNVLNNLNTVLNSTSGITYTSNGDITLIDNNVTINKDLIIQGLNVKAEIDALDTSIATVVFTSTNATITNLTATNLTSTSGTITNLISTNGTITNLTSTNLTSTNLTSTNLTSTNGTITDLSCNNISFNEIVNNPAINIETNVTPTITYFSNTSTPSKTNFSNSGSVQLYQSIIVPKNVTPTLNSNIPIHMFGSGTFTYSLGIGAPDKDLVVDEKLKITHTLTGIVVNVRKNGVSQYNLTTSFNNALPITKEVTVNVGTFSYSQYLTNISFSFTPTLETVDTTWQLRFTPTYTINNEIVNTSESNYSYSISNGFTYFNTVPTTTFTYTQQSRINYVLAPGFPTTGSLSFLNSVASNYTSNVNSVVLQPNNIIYSSNKGLLQTNVLVSNTIYNNNYVISKKMITGYMFSTSTPNQTIPYPIFFSTKEFTADVDDYFIIEAGYKYMLYNGYNYSSLLGTIDNSDNIEPLFIKSTDVYSGSNQVASIRVYYINVEQTNIVFS